MWYKQYKNKEAIKKEKEGILFISEISYLFSLHTPLHKSFRTWD